MSFKKITAITMVFCMLGFYPMAFAEEQLGFPKISGQGYVGKDGRSWKEGWFKSLFFEGTTEDAYEIKITPNNPTADRVIVLPNTSGGLVTTGDSSTISSGMIATYAVTTGHITDNAITSAKIAADVIVADDISTGAVGTTEILDATIATADITDSAVTSAKIAADTIVADDISTGAVTTTEILDGTVSATDIANVVRYFQLPLTGFVSYNGSPVDVYTVPGFEIDDLLPNIVWADGEISPISITFIIPEDYASGGAFKVLATESGTSTPNQIDFLVYINKDGTVADSSATDQTPVAMAGTSSTPDVVTLTPATDFASLASGDWVTLQIWRDDTATGTNDLEVKGVTFFYTATQ